MIDNIENKDYHKIGINCRAGRHRSVTLAIILRDYYYPNAECHFLEI
jgi:RNase adaptor protein for sRNA GlmZ degradation